MTQATMTRRKEVAEREAVLSALPWYVRVLAEQSPVGYQAGDNNLYRFVGNDPTNMVDPTGLFGAGGVAYTPKGPMPYVPGQTPPSPYMPRTPGQPACDEHIDPRRLRGGLCDNDEQRQQFNRGCIGICGVRLGHGLCDPQKLPGTRCFTTYEDAKAFQTSLTRACYEPNRSRGHSLLV